MEGDGDLIYIYSKIAEIVKDTLRCSVNLRIRGVK
jgi:hypothetical protein